MMGLCRRRRQNLRHEGFPLVLRRGHNIYLMKTTLVRVDTALAAPTRLEK